MLYDADTKTLIALWVYFPVIEIFDYIEHFIITGKSVDLRLILVDPYEGRLPEEMKSTTLIPYYLEKFKEVYYINASTYNEHTIDYVRKSYLGFSNLKCGGNVKYEWLFHMKTRIHNEDKLKQAELEKAVPDRHFVSLNSVPRLFRGHIIDSLMVNGLLDTLYYSWVLTGEPYGTNDVFNRFKMFDPNKEVLLDLNRTQVHRNSNYLTSPIEYFKGLIDIFAETECDSFNYKDVFITEKTWKPIMRKKIFFGFNSAGYYETLKNEGFRLYDKIFDYSFDNITDHYERFDEYIKNVIRIAQMPLTEVIELVKSHKDDTEFNFNHACQIEPVFPKILKPYAEKFRSNDLCFLFGYT
jgi:hypothetical protein